MSPTIACNSFLLILALGCNAASALPPHPPQDDGAPPGPATTIRFGDPQEIAYGEAFFPGASYDGGITRPDSILGQTHGTRLSHHAEILACFRAWAEESPRMTLHTYARSHEGRELVYAVVTSEANHARLDEIRRDLARLHDPRGLSEAEAEAIVAGTPPVAWMGYSIHGDELSGCDAAVALGHHLVASLDDDVRVLLDRTVVVIDPCMNPDGRERIISQVEQTAGYTPNLDYASMHRGRWPYGRGNHYLFDMNRDWMAGTQPETRGRWRAVLGFHPQLFVDAHEMGSLDTFLFYPQAKPLNPHFPPQHARWHEVFAADAAHAFDARGWGYYTREWADGWAPFYSDAWAALTGAIGILYEQASTSGFPLRRASGAVLTYREAVHHQLTASLANITTLSERREEVLADYLANKRRNVAADTPGNDRTLAFTPGEDVRREAELVRLLTGQGVEVYRSSAELEGKNAAGSLGQHEDARGFPRGTILVPARQPMAQIVKAYLGFDPRIDVESLEEEREEIERKGETKIYDLTAWSLPHGLGLDAWWIDAVEVEAERIFDLPRPAGTVLRAEDPDAEPVAWVVDGRGDGSVVFAAAAMELGLRVHVADEPFTAEGRGFARGSLLVRRHENGEDLDEILARIARAADRSGVTVIATSSGRSPDEGPDLGGGHFHLLSRPRVAVLANAPVSSDTYGHLWHHLDTELGIPFTFLDAQRLGGYDLRRYNVLILPPASGDLRGLLEPLKGSLQAWVESGGTLIACANSAAAVSASGLGLTSVVLRRDALEDLEPYALAAERERAAREIEIDEAEVWGDAPGAAEPEGDEQDPQDEDEDEEEPIDGEEDRWLRRFAPYGVTLLADVDQESWLTYGCDERMAVLFTGARVFLSRPPVRTAVRLVAQDRLRLAGLVWPEARERIADSAWLTVESRGHGQVILFAAMPAFRGYHDATARPLSNAVVYGPGVGASQPIDW